MPSLLLLTGPHAGRRHSVEGEVIVGRSPSCAIALDDSKVSRRHAQLFFEGNRARVSDLGSRNGTQLNGEKIDGEVEFLPGDRLQIGDSLIAFEGATRVLLSDGSLAELKIRVLDEVLSSDSALAGILEAMRLLQSASSEAAVLKVGAAMLLKVTNARVAACFLSGSDGLLTSAVAGEPSVLVPKAMSDAALGKQQVSVAAGKLSAPLSASGVSVGVAFAERDTAWLENEIAAAAALGQLIAAALSTLKVRTIVHDSPVSLLGTSKAFRKMVDSIRRAAADDHHSVVSGPAGSGLSLVTRLIHQKSARALGPLVVVDCRQPESQLETALFDDAQSLLRRALGGTLVIDHLEDLSMIKQLKLAAVPLNDVRLIAISREPLEDLVKRQVLTAGLAHFFTGPAVEVSSLHDRKSDVPALWELFADEVAREQHQPAVRLSTEARRVLCEYAWPGNVSELRLVTRRLALLHGGKTLESSQLPDDIVDGVETPTLSLADRVTRLERELIQNALVAARGKKLQAAKLLGISRPTLDKKIQEFQLTVEKLKQ